MHGTGGREEGGRDVAHLDEEHLLAHVVLADDVLVGHVKVERDELDELPHDHQAHLLALRVLLPGLRFVP